MPSDAKVIHLGPREGNAFSVVGDVYRVLVSSAHTGGVYTLVENRVSPNNGPPPHIHSREDESFFVLEGELEFQVGDETSRRHPARSFKGREALRTVLKTTRSCRARVPVFVTPAGFENFVKEFAQPVPSFDSPAIPASKEEVDKLMAAAPKCGIQILPPGK